MEQNLNFSSRNATIDGWRGISIILVLLGHFGRAIGEDSFLGRYTFADEGVHIFFIISGYLITHLLLSRMHSAQKETQPIKKFYLRRFLRILPAFYLFHLVLLLLRSAEFVDFSNALFVKNLLFLSNFNFWGGTWVLGHIWSLSVEEQFYLVWPWLVYYLPLNRLNWLCLLVIAMSPFIRVANYLYPQFADFWAGGFFQHADSIAFGALLSLLVFSQKENVLKRLAQPLVLLVLGLCTAGLWWLKHEQHLGILTVPLFYSFFSLFFTLLIQETLTLKLPTLGNILNHPILGFVGKISFSLYLWQQFFLWPAQYRDASTGGFLQMVPWNVLAVFVVALLSYFMVEKTFLSWKERWSL